MLARRGAVKAGGGCCPRISPLPRAQTELLSYTGGKPGPRGPDPFTCQRSAEPDTCPQEELNPCFLHVRQAVCR